ncbi:MAG: hypothetical protein RL722_1506 [Pseudomonadota bacterium]
MRIHLLPERAAWVARSGPAVGADHPRPRQLLLLADVHFGKAASFRRLGVPVPVGTTEANLARLDAILARLDRHLGEPAVQEVVFLGDFLHAASGRSAGTLDALQRWRDREGAALHLTLVRGNHDDHAGDPPASLAMQVVDEPWCHPDYPELSLGHHPQTAQALGPEGARPQLHIAGHVHPVARLGRGFEALTLPCFHLGGGGARPAAEGVNEALCAQPPAATSIQILAGLRHDAAGLGPGRLPSGATLVLPAFGEFTGGALVRPGLQERVFVVDPGGGQVLELPSRPAAAPVRDRGSVRQRSN